LHAAPKLIVSVSQCRLQGRVRRYFRNWALRYELRVGLDYVTLKDADLKLLFLHHSYLSVAMPRLRVFFVEDAVLMNFTVHQGHYTGPGPLSVNRLGGK